MSGNTVKYNEDTSEVNVVDIVDQLLQKKQFMDMLVENKQFEKQLQEAMLRVFDRMDIQKKLAKVFQDTEFARLQEDIANLKKKSNSFPTSPSAQPKAVSEARQHHISKTLIDKTFKRIEQDWKNQPDNWERKSVSDFITEWWKNYTWNDPILVSLQKNNPMTYDFTQKNLPIEVNKRFYTWLVERPNATDDNDVAKIRLEDSEFRQLKQAREAFEKVDIRLHKDTPFWKKLQDMKRDEQKNKLWFFRPPDTFMQKGREAGMVDDRIREAWKREVINKKGEYQPPKIVLGSNMPTDNYHLTFD